MVDQRSAQRTRWRQSRRAPLVVVVRHYRLFARLSGERISQQRIMAGRDRKIQRQLCKAVMDVGFIPPVRRIKLNDPSFQVAAPVFDLIQSCDLWKLEGFLEPKFGSQFARQLLFQTPAVAHRLVSEEKDAVPLLQTPNERLPVLVGPIR